MPTNSCSFASTCVSGGVDGFFCRPSSPQPVEDIVRDSVGAIPFSERLGFSFVSEKPRRPSVSSLLFRSSPAAVVGTVWSVHILSLNRVCGTRPSSHVSQEVLEALPSFADLDSSTSVVFVADDIRVVAPVEHGPPRSVLNRLARFSMCSSAIRQPFFVKASTRGSATAEKVVGENERGLPASTMASPLGPPFVGHSVQYCESAEYHSGKVFGCRHDS